MCKRKIVIISIIALLLYGVGQIEKHCEILHASLDIIEACGGGSARCMMAEVFLPKME